MKELPYEQSDIIELVRENAAAWLNVPKELLWVTLISNKGKIRAKVTHKNKKDLEVVFTER